MVALVGVTAALLAHRLVDEVGVLTWSVLLGAVATNVNLIPAAVRPGLHRVTRVTLRVGVVLLGFSLSVVSILALGAPVIALVVGTLLCTLLATLWAGRWLGLGRPRSMLVATGFAICGASAVAAMQETAEADEDDVASAIAMVTICGTAAMVALPLLQHPLGLTDTEFGIWAGASVHEVGQVIAAAGPAGATAVAVAVVVKLTRVLLLAPVVAAFGLRRRHKLRGTGTGQRRTQLPPVVPLFVAGFAVCVAIRSTGTVPEPVLDLIGTAQTVALGAALFGMGTGVHLKSLVRRSGRALALAVTSTAVIAGVSLAGVQLVV